MIEEVILFQIDQTTKKAKMYSQREFDRLGLDITVEQWILLKIIEESNGMSQREIAEKSLRDPASITRTLDLLEKKGFVARQPIEGNRRQYRIILTGNGQKFVEKHMPLVSDHRSKSIEGLTQNELRVLKKALSKIQDNMS